LTPRSDRERRRRRWCFHRPGRLSAALGYLGHPNHPDVIKIIDDMIPRIKNAGCAPGILTGDAELASNYIDRGCLFAAVGSDIDCWPEAPINSRQNSKRRIPGGEHALDGNRIGGW